MRGYGSIHKLDMQPDLDAIQYIYYDMEKQRANILITSDVRILTYMQ